LYIGGGGSEYYGCCVQFFMDECNHQLQDEIEAREKELSSMLLADRVAQIVRLRLQMQVPYLSKWAQALSVQVTITTKVPLLHKLKVT
jgi:ubiquinone biosynthesis protein COQ9